MTYLPRDASTTSYNTFGRNRGGNAAPATQYGNKAKRGTITGPQKALLIKLTTELIDRTVEAIKADPETFPADKVLQWEVAVKEQKLALETDFDGLTKTAAGDKISQLLDSAKAARIEASRKARAAAPVVKSVPDGFYVFNGQVFKVQTSQSSGNSYASVLVPQVDEDGKPARGKFVYTPGSVRNLTPDMVLDKDKAVTFGQLYGICSRCGAVLSAEDSIERMMGPVCFGKI